MKVFVSSTCYDLVDLRAELHEDLRDLGVETLFSDLRESEFVVPADEGLLHVPIVGAKDINQEPGRDVRVALGGGELVLA